MSRFSTGNGTRPGRYTEFSLGTNPQKIGQAHGLASHVSFSLLNWTAVSRDDNRLRARGSGTGTEDADQNAGLPVSDRL
jgi:hypothetical protein